MKTPIKNAKISKKLISETNSSNGSKKTTVKKKVKSKTTKLDTLKEAMIQALESTLGIVTTAAKKIGIDRTTHYLWMQDENYKKRVEGIADIALDFVESKLHGQIAKGDTTASIFYLKTKGKQRGYIERTEIDHSIRKDTDIPVIGWSTTQEKKDAGK